MFHGANVSLDSLCASCSAWPAHASGGALLVPESIRDGCPSGHKRRAEWSGSRLHGPAQHFPADERRGGGGGRSLRTHTSGTSTHKITVFQSEKMIYCFIQIHSVFFFYYYHFLRLLTLCCIFCGWYNKSAR